MKIVLAHNFYGSAAPSGENHVYVEEAGLLRDNGHEVIELTRHSDRIRARGVLGALRGGASTPWNPFAVRELRKLIRRERPDVVHVHNFFPLLSPGVFHAATGSQTATVLTLHNYRLFCSAGIPLRDNKVCTRCLDERSVRSAVRYGCYRGSRIATLPLAAMIALHRTLGTWHHAVDAFIALTSFQRDTMIAAGLPAELVKIKPHFYRDPPSPQPWTEREDKVVYMGRLGPEKGVLSLIRAWERWGTSAPTLELIGDGSEKNALQDIVRNSTLAGRVHFTGQLPFDEAQQRLARARLLVVPSLSFEGLPLVIREACALGVPVAGSRLGAIPAMVTEGETGRLFRPGDVQDLHDTVRALWNSPAELGQMSRAAHIEFQMRYTAHRNHAMLMDIYKAAIGVRLARERGAYRALERE